MYQTNESLWTDEHRIFRQTVRSFLAAEVEPHIDEWAEQHAVPRGFWRKAAEAGLLGVDVPEEYGGPGGDFLHRLVIAEEIGYSPAGAVMAPSLIADGTCEILYRSANEEQRRKYLPAMVRGELLFGLAITEPDSGSDVSATRTVAQREGDEYVITGAKTYISQASVADAFMVVARTGEAPGAKGLSMIVVEADRPGFRRGRALKKMGVVASNTGEIAFDEVRVPVSNLLGEEGRGMALCLGGVNMDRITWPLIAHAASTRALEETIAFVKNRKAFGQTIFDFQNTQFRLAEMKTELAVGRAFLDDVIRDYQANGQLDTLKCAMAKMWLPEMEARIMDMCVQLHGGAGYMEEYPISRFYTAARLHRIFAGTAEIMRLIVSRSL
ncbi:acyl-CoA dehydrogenase family protein [Sandaracinobacter sp. RS1-74]|uniref:acyl-CoA dehydrogenase family protein n=1 Tax=Sandaracinobacteroides sayramensis TaxID=2913411 RepID=UPI001EDA1B24|nr:acyl-CoA dehydrogenase family protein [Sandaracinobacteroides sayramensis]MCG2840920.1 acyl-CoA dehydrogenase family protein [Sandaracinobacteroides sayramensis]